MKPFTLIHKMLSFTLAAAVLTFTSCKKDSNSNLPDQQAQNHQV
ncbi:hypothetical protein [Mucilaginibacter lacusdianchii]|nr:hypothetical protein [Mucilaginibacter sp. JXJ CY 39]